MGYYVKSLFAVNPNDAHSYFVYFVPGGKPYMSLSTEWINSWVHKHFQNIAEAVGPTGVVVSPLPRNNWNDDIADSGMAWPFMDAAEGEDDFLHGHMPFLLVSRSPIQKKNANECDGIAINLVKCVDEKELAYVFDQLINAIRQDNWESIVENFPLQEAASEPDSYGGWLERLNSVVELKPNIFGLGINLNAALQEVAKKFTHENRDN